MSAPAGTAPRPAAQMLTCAAGVCLALGAARSGPPDAAPNDNRRPAGTLRDGVLTVALVAREAVWHPDGPGGGALAVRAFAEEGGAPSVPGPLVRVRAGRETRSSRPGTPTVVPVRVRAP